MRQLMNAMETSVATDPLVLNKNGRMKNVLAGILVDSDPDDVKAASRRVTT